MPTAPPEGASGDYSSIKFAGMHTLISDVTSAGTTLQHTTEGLQSQASACSVSSPAFAQIIEIGSWAAGQVDGLQRRLTLAESMQDLAAGGKLTDWTISEPVAMTTAQAIAKGKELAKKLQDQHRTDANMANAYHDVANELGTYSNDPDVLSAFMSSLGAQGVQSIPAMIRAGGKDTAPGDLSAYSKALGGAFNDPYPPAGFADVTAVFTNQPDQRDKSGSWNRLALLQDGNFPAGFLSQAVRANGLTQLSKDGYVDDWRGGMTNPFHLPEDNVAMMYSALRNNPGAARGAFAGLDLKKLTETAYGVVGALATGESIASAFGLAVQAASGTNDEKSGQHSAPAAAFAFDFMRASGSVKNVPDQVKTSLGKIAASYAPELLTGSEKFDAGQRDSSMTAPPNFDVLPGVDPAFYLSQSDTYKFLHGFASDDKYSAEFDIAVGQLYDGSLTAAAKEQKAHPDSAVWDNTLRRYGQLAGLEYAAQKDVRGDMDQADADSRALINNVFGAGLLLVSGPGGALAKAGWKVGMYGFALARGKWVKGDPEATRKALVEDSESRAGFLVSYQLASKLVDAKYPGTEKVPSELLQDGHLKAPKDIAADAHLIDLYQKWTDASDSGSKTDYDQVLDTGTTDFDGGQQDAENQTSGYDW